MNEKLKELIDLYKENDKVEAIYLTTYLEQNVKILELNLVANNFGISTKKSFNFEDNYRIIVSLVALKDLELKYENERNLVKLANSSILYDSSDKLDKLKDKIIKIMDNEPLVSMYNEITFYDVPDITNGISK